ncbi:hypothetical protein, partial [Ralstonia solanacearum]
PLRGSIRSTVRVNLNLALNTEILTLPSLLEFVLQGGRGGKFASLRQPSLFFLPATQIQGAA